MSRSKSLVVTLMLMVGAAPAAAQYVDPDTCSMANYSCQRARQERDDKRAADDAQSRAAEAADQALRQKLLRLPPLPVERNVLLGTWRVEGGGQGSDLARLGQEKGSANRAAFIDQLAALVGSGKFLCTGHFGNGITFATSTYSISALDGSKVGGSVAYRSSQKDVIWTLPSNAKARPYEIAGPNRILYGDCALVRVGASAANAAVNAATAPGNAHTAAARSSVPPAAGAMPQMAAVANVTSAKLAVGPDAGGYLCPDGRQLYVKSCYDDSSESRCGVVNMHLPPRNDFQVVTTEIRSEVLSRVAACKILPLQFMNGTVSLVMPKSAPP